ncbi:NAD(P)-binding protein [Aspergillus heteromorphus CBS 117.55]|uniref:NAD(P)-binding protein n=1 Tax=Aspergillus heteromorphus CBS 117.55 TaxID=1448321 RepID=A0A317VN82_9EURO|nr:NAD(P)-binding protein [Aspergillus heteromorphus CBS 117.55]PWY75385.1 NAD(P)-binding protein [Aspergillus heteromorphus CBS 117.55]
MSNSALTFSQIPTGYPVPGQDLTITPAPYDSSAPAPENGIFVQSLYASFDPYMRGRMRPAETKSYAPAFTLHAPIDSAIIARVLRSNHASYKEGDLIIGHLPIQSYISVSAEQLVRVRALENPLAIEDVRVFLGALGMPGLTAYSSLYEIGKPKKGETIFVSAASGAVGQLVGQLAKHEGLTVIGSVGSDEKLDYITGTLGFDGGFNYKKESPAEALKRLAPQGIDIYYENVGGEHLEAALDAMNNFGRVVVCGMISQYNASERYPIRNITNVLVKRLDMRGFIVGDKGMGDKYAREHQENVQKWIKEGSFKSLIHQTEGIENAAEGLVGIFYGRNLGKAVLKF